MPRTITEATPDAKLEDASLRIYRVPDGAGGYQKRVHVTLVVERSDGSSAIKEWDRADSQIKSLTVAQKARLLSAVRAILQEARADLELEP